MFELTDDDMEVIAIAIEAIRHFLRNDSLDAQQLIGLGNALYALERLPEVTDGAFCEFGVIYRYGGESRYIEFEVSEHAFGISIGSSVYDSGIGSDHISEPGWRVEAGGFRETNDIWLLSSLSDQISELLNLGADIVVRDESCIDFE